MIWCFLKFFLSMNLLIITLQSKCSTIPGKSGLYITVNGSIYPCASTTRTWSNNQGACGCGTSSNGAFPWVSKDLYLAGGGPQIFGSGTWCGSGCGQCYSITPTGDSPNGRGTNNIVSITVMITDLCQGGNFCNSPLNSYGYSAHFNLVDYNMNGGITALGWDNVEVYYTPVTCPTNLQKDFSQCQCSSSINNNNSSSSNSTPNIPNPPTPSPSSEKCQTINGMTGLWFNVNGNLYPCASTTRYFDGSMGACGCGSQTSNNIFSWQYQIYTAAASSKIFGSSSTWCGMGCGQCFQIKPTGYSQAGKGASNLTQVIVMVTNLCPDGGGWCSSGVNQYGYTAHFDMMDYNMNGMITQLGWDNPEVYYTKVTCPTQQITDFNQCQCKGKTPAYTGPSGPAGEALAAGKAAFSGFLKFSLIVLFLKIILII